MICCTIRYSNGRKSSSHKVDEIRLFDDSVIRKDGHGDTHCHGHNIAIHSMIRGCTAANGQRPSFAKESGGHYFDPLADSSS
ncbi:hypothetical protein ZWY2020_050636 [Hordeum vulgare]|nr:hypothetical protein ZWY2020_050636 [Hordeum vulgare]